MGLLTVLFVFSITQPHITGMNPGLMSKSRIRPVKAAALPRLSTGTVCPSGSRDVKRKEKERVREGGNG